MSKPQSKGASPKPQPGGKGKKNQPAKGAAASNGDHSVPGASPVNGNSKGQAGGKGKQGQSPKPKPKPQPAGGAGASSTAATTPTKSPNAGKKGKNQGQHSPAAEAAATTATTPSKSPNNNKGNQQQQQKKGAKPAPTTPAAAAPSPSTGGAETAAAAGGKKKRKRGAKQEGSAAASAAGTLAAAAVATIAAAAVSLATGAASGTEEKQAQQQQQGSQGKRQAKKKARTAETAGAVAADASTSAAAGGAGAKKGKKAPQQQQQGQQPQAATANKQQQKGKGKGKQQQGQQQQAQKGKQKQGQAQQAKGQQQSSGAAAGSWLQWLLGPGISVERFFDEFWEKAPLLVKSKQRRSAFPLTAATAANRNGKLFTRTDFNEILKTKPVFYTHQLNVSKVDEEGHKEILNPNGKASLAQVDEFFKDGCTLQFFQPQQHSKVLHSFLAGLESQFGCLVGANVYMTPAGSQGLAPHYDDVEAFIIQTEGKKHWKLYQPPPTDLLPLEYSRDLETEELPEPLKEFTLEEGDFLYFPRGTIHHARADPSGPSTHITISSYQRNTWAEYLKVALPIAIDEAAEEDLEFRRGLPVNYLSYMGIVYDPQNRILESEEGASIAEELPAQSAFRERVLDLLTRLPQHLKLHEAADVMSYDFLSNRLPPADKKQSEEDDSDETEVAEIVVEGGMRVKLHDPSWLRLVLPDSEDEEDGDEGEVQHVHAGDDDDDEDDEDEESEDDEQAEAAAMEMVAARRKGKKADNDVDDDDNEDDSEEDADEIAALEDQLEGEEGHFLLCHSLDNEQETHMSGLETSARSLRLPVECYPAIMHLWHNYPEPVTVDSLPELDDEKKRRLIADLIVEGLVHRDE